MNLPIFGGQCELILATISFQGFGDVKEITWKPSGSLIVDFKEASVADEVCAFLALWVNVITVWNA